MFWHGREEAAHRDGSPYQRVRGILLRSGMDCCLLQSRGGGLQAGHSLVERMERGASRDAPATLGMAVAPEAAASAVARYHGTARCG